MLFVITLCDQRSESETEPNLFGFQGGETLALHPKSVFRLEDLNEITLCPICPDAEALFVRVVKDHILSLAIKS